MIENILSTLVVSLEQEIGFKPNEVRHIKLKPSKNNFEAIKSVYSGGRFNSKSKVKVNYSCKMEKIMLSRCLFEAYQVGSRRLQSEAKRRYYKECL